MWSPVSVQGSPIILFHDSLGSVELWRGFPAALATRTGRKVIAYDRLGFGQSDPRSDTLDMDFIADEAETYFPALRAELGINRFVAFGHSVGGGMAVNCAAKFSDTCDALITESAQAFVEDRTLQGIRAAQALFEDTAQVERLGRYHGDKARWVLDAWIDTWLSPAFSNWSLDSVLPRVTCPLLAIHGADDEYGSPRHPELIGRLAGGPTRVEVIPDTHHVPHREREAAVLDLVAEFLSSNS
jgi:pimeloyl-ACP methyl ester carboxylesterase